MKIVFMGTPAAAAVSLRQLMDDGHEIVGVYTQPDRPSGRGNKIVFSPVKEVAVEYDLRLLQPSKIRNQQALDEFRSLNADIAAVVAYGRILPEGFLNAFQKGAINLHFSLLPKYRGAAPVNWSIVNGESRTGVTTIQMDAGLDTGDILLASETDIGKFETAPELMDRLAVIGAKVLSETLSRIDVIVPVPQDDSLATLAPIMKREDGLIDWARPAGEIFNRVRGFQPFPGSFTFLQGKKVTVWTCEPAEPAAEASETPGEVVLVGKDHLMVAASGGSMLKIKELQFEGKKRMSVTDALNGVKISTGDRFSSSPS